MSLSHLEKTAIPNRNKIKNLIIVYTESVLLMMVDLKWRSQNFGPGGLNSGCPILQLALELSAEEFDLS